VVVRVEYDRSNRVGYAYEGQVMGLPIQSPRGANFSIGGRALLATTLAPAGNRRPDLQVTIFEILQEIQAKINCRMIS